MTATTNQSTTDMARQFADALAAVGGVTHHAADVAEATALVQELCAGRQVATHADPLVDEVTASLDRTDDPWAADVGVTSAFVAVAKTGTLVLTFGAGRTRSTPLVPLVHVAVVPCDRLVPTYRDAMDALASLATSAGLPSGVQCVTGPSSSGDIEMVLVRGMHGPAEVHVVLVEAAGDTAVSSTERS